MARYDLRKNGYFGFEPEEVKADPILSHVRDKLKYDPDADFYSFEVDAQSEEEALEMFIGDFYCSEKDLSAFTVMQDVNW